MVVGQGLIPVFLFSTVTKIPPVLHIYIYIYVALTSIAMKQRLGKPKKQCCLLNRAVMAKKMFLILSSSGGFYLYNAICKKPQSKQSDLQIRC